MIKNYKRKDVSAFDFYFEDTIPTGETILILPPVSAHKMSVCDIGWQCSGNVSIYATCQQNPEEATLWEKCEDGEKIAETATALKIVNGGGECLFASRVIMA